MGIHVIKTPDIGEGIAEVELVAWHVRPGDNVLEDQPLADVMTEKANVEIPSPVAGKVVSLAGEIGQTVSVGADLIHIEVEGSGNVRAPVATQVEMLAAPVKPEAREEVTSKAEPAVAVKEATRPAVRSSAANVPEDQTSHPKPLASPSVRKHAWDRGIELRFVEGSGSVGQVTREDLDAYEARRLDGTSQVNRSSSYAPRTEEVRVPVIGLRRKIAERMQEAKRSIPHFTYVEELDVTELEALRVQLNAKWDSTRGRLTRLPFIARAIVLALRAFPQINARFDDEAGVVTRFGAVHLGVATQTANGLLVPVVRHAESLGLWETASEIARLAAASRSGKATRDELSNSTITVTSLGALGGIVSTPVINRPEVAIVGVNRIVERPVVHRGSVVPRLMMNLSSSFDHRVVDGTDAAGFIQAVRSLLEVPATLFLEP